MFTRPRLRQSFSICQDPAQPHVNNCCRHSLRSAHILWMVLLIIVIAASQSKAQTYTVKGNFTATTKGTSLASLVEGTDGNFYVTTTFAGTHKEGSILKITPDGTISVLYSFCSLANCADGEYPFAGLTLGNDGNLYGVTAYGGAGSCPSQKNGCGTIFKITSAGKLTTLHSFSSTDGRDPQGPLFLAANGSFYGMTVLGGANDSGTVFKTTPTGSLTTLYSFCSLANCADGLWPINGLTQGKDGNFYGTTGGSDTYGGTVFKMTATGTLTTLFTFCNDTEFYCTDGAYPSGLIQAGNGSFYGTTYTGGPIGAGTVFRITSQGALTVLHTFQNTGTDGMEPRDSLTLGTDGNLYGTTQNGGLTGVGTLFEITPNGKFTTLYSLYCEPDYCIDGSTVDGSLVQGTDGTFYGTADEEGVTGYGTFFNLITGLQPFVKTLPTRGTANSAVTIVGSYLTGATSVGFNGTAAQFTVISDSEIKTKVPTGATTGKLTVVTPTGTFTSHTAFQVQ
jgi:uncharacterized repeat protein (TIGR03803 family)